MTDWVRVRGGQYAGMVGSVNGEVPGGLELQLGGHRVVLPDHVLEPVPAGTPSSPRPAAFCPDCDDVHPAGECVLVQPERDPLWLRVVARAARWVVPW